MWFQQVLILALFMKFVICICSALWIKLSYFKNWQWYYNPLILVNILIIIKLSTSGIFSTLLRVMRGNSSHKKTDLMRFRLHNWIYEDLGLCVCLEKIWTVSFISKIQYCITYFTPNNILEVKFTAFFYFFWFICVKNQGQ